MELIHENLRETCLNFRDLVLVVRFKSCVTVQAPAQFGTHKNDSFQVFRIRNEALHLTAVASNLRDIEMLIVLKQ